MKGMIKDWNINLLYKSNNYLPSQTFTNPYKASLKYI